MYRAQGIGQDIMALPSGTSQYCENVLPNMCALTQKVIDTAKADCAAIERRSQTRGIGMFGGLGKICTLYENDRKVGMSTYNRWDPCLLAKLSLCDTPTAPPTQSDVPVITVNDTPMDQPEEEEDSEDDNSMFMVGGILGLLVLGGVGYAVFKNRKKKGKGKKKKR